MAEQFKSLDQDHIDFINRQQLFYVATAAVDGLINVSPKGMDSLRIMAPDRVVWLNLTGSGNETAAHLLENSRMTIMFCSFDKQPLILRLYGTARAIHPRDPEWDKLISQFPMLPGARQLLDVSLNLVQTSCGYAVPRYEFLEERQTLSNWSEKKGESGIAAYWADENQLSMEGRPTDILPSGEALD